jgi:glyoxylate/hydroxypyruvate reductase
VTVALFLPPHFRTTELWLAELQRSLPAEHIELAELITDPALVDVALVRGADPGPLANYANLQFVHCLWAGVEQLLNHPDLPADLPLARLVDPAMADHMAASVVAHVLDITLGHDRYRGQQREQVWEPHHLPTPSRLTVGILGLGELGRRCAELLTALRFTLIGSTRSQRSPHEVAAGADIVVNLLPLTDTTTGLLNAEFFAAMRPGASLINVARGGHVIEADLLAALNSGHLHRAVLDVCAVEPLPQADPLWMHPSVTITPHVAANTDLVTAAPIIAANVTAFRSGRLAAITGMVDRTRGY